MHLYKNIIFLGLLSSTSFAETQVDKYGLELNTSPSISLFSESQAKRQGKKGLSEKMSSQFSSVTSSPRNWTIYSKEKRRVCEIWEGEIPRITNPDTELERHNSNSNDAISSLKIESIPTSSARRRCKLWNEYPAHTYGTAHIYNSYDNVLDKPVIVVQPYNISLNGGTYSESQFYSDINNGGLANSLRSDGYDVILYRYKRQDNGIVFNANGVKRLLEKINEQSGVSSTSVIGLSMGGVVARYALASLEKSTGLNNVATYISFDAPHLGANFPKAILDNTNRLLDKVDSRLCGLSGKCRNARQQLQAVKKKVTTKTFKELIFPISTKERSTLLSQLATVGHVKTIPTLALTNGAQSKTQGFARSKLTTHFKLHRKWYNGGSKYFKVITKPNIDNTAGGYSNFYQVLSNLISNQSHPITPYVTVGQRHSFVSTLSALAGSSSNFTEVATYPSSNEQHMTLSYAKRLKIRQWLDKYQY